MANSNFLLGRGELLTKRIDPPPVSPKLKEVYSLEETKRRLLPLLANVISEAENLPDDACPRDFVVSKLTLNPSFIAKTLFPSGLLRQTNMFNIGSRNVRIRPEKWNRSAPVEECFTTQLFVASKRSMLRNFKEMIENTDEQLQETSKAFRDQLGRVESFQGFSEVDRLQANQSISNLFHEIVLQGMEYDETRMGLTAFSKYAKKFGVELYEAHEFQAGGLMFIPIRAPQEALIDLAKFAFVRSIRPMPRLRGIRLPARAGGVSVTCSLPDSTPVSEEPAVAVLDGGLPEEHAVKTWVRNYRKSDSSEKDYHDGPAHGLGVTSAVLFGPINPGEEAERPYSYVDHYRVLDTGIDQEPELELYRTLGFIEEILLSRQYEFINLSLGPNLPIEEQDVHVWTSVIDGLLSDGQTLMSIAVGNNGELDVASGNARIQVPSDAVNGLSIGATNTDTSSWQRAPYSAIGPGRSPGYIKPDLVAFGGSTASYFHVLVDSPDSKNGVTPVLGTSFASPYALRQSIAIRALLGRDVTALTIKALLIHTADRNGHLAADVGWGKVATDIGDIVTTEASTVRVIYQGHLIPGKYLRAPLPLEGIDLNGNVMISATFCYASPIDPQHTISYTRAGLDIKFRPNQSKGKQSHPDTKGFFSAKKYASEAELRSDTGKWETVLHAQKTFRGTSLSKPAFDIHYNAREAGAATGTAEKIPYSLVITIKAPKHVNLYGEISNIYSEILSPIVLKTTVPVKV